LVLKKRKACSQIILADCHGIIVHNVIGIDYSSGRDFCLLQEPGRKAFLLEKQVAAVKDQVRKFMEPFYFFQLVCFFGQTAQLTA
jgi:hypothetical protein